MMYRIIVQGITAALLMVNAAWGQDSKPEVGDSLKASNETRYLAFQIFSYGPNPIIPTMGEGPNPQPAKFPDKSVLHDYIGDIKQRIGIVGGQQNRLAVMLGQLSFDHGDTETSHFIELGFELALETDVAVGFHIDDSMFWAGRKDLWSDPKNVEAMDWEGTPCTGRSLEWQTGPGAKADAAPPQMCFNSNAIQTEIRQRGALLGQSIQAGLNRLSRLKRTELFAGVIVGSETMIGQDFKTGKYLGYRALINLGFSRERPPQDMNLEREKIVQEFIEHWTQSVAQAGVSPEKIYSHTAFLSRRAFKIGNNTRTTYSEHNHFAPPTVAFGKHHRPGFSTYPQPGLFDDIYEQLVNHQQRGWASCEGTNLQLGSGPGQSGMNMETYLAKVFNHGGTLVNIFSWGIGGEAMKNMDFRVVTECEEALQSYRKFLKGETLIEAKTESLTLLERLPPKIHKIQKELPAWIQKNGDPEKATSLMKKLDGHMKATDFKEAEDTADTILTMMSIKATPAGETIPQEALQKLRHELGGAFLVSRDKVQEELNLTQEQKEKLERHLRELLPDIMHFFQSLEGLQRERREKELSEYRPKALEKMTTVLNDTLNGGQQTRLHQLERQREGLREGKVWNDLHVTDQQRKQFVILIQQAQQKIQPLIEEAQKSGNVTEIQPKVIKIRDELEVALRNILTDDQKTLWKKLLGTPMDLADLFDL